MTIVAYITETGYCYHKFINNIHTDNYSSDNSDDAMDDLVSTVDEFTCLGKNVVEVFILNDFLRNKINTIFKTKKNIIS